MPIPSRVVAACVVLAFACAPSAEPGPDAGSVTTDDIFCGSRGRVRKVDRYNEGAANLETERSSTNTCWRVIDHGDGTYTLFERLGEGGDGEADGFCRVEIRKVSNFQAETTGGECVWLESTPDGPGTFRALVDAGGPVQLESADSINLATDLKTTTLSIGEPREYVIRGRAALFYDGRRSANPAKDPGDPASEVLADPAACALPGCWEGTLTSLQHEGCEVAATDPPAGVTYRYVISDDRRTVTPEGSAAIVAAPELGACAAATTTGSFFSGQWRVRLATEGERLRVSARFFAQGSSCQRYLEGTWTRCE